MEAQNKSVKETSKLIGITNKKVISQAMEYLRLLKIKTNFKAKNEYARIVLCLDISATKANQTIDFDKGLKLTKYGKIKYRNEMNTILRILDINQAPNVKSICYAIKLSKAVQKNALLMLEIIKKNKSNLLGEIGHPQNHYMAVYQSCKSLNVQVNERKLIDLSRLQRKQWTQLKALWSPWLEEPKTTKRNSKSAKNSVTNNLLQAHPIRAIESATPIESYDVWKKRILDKARADLALLKTKRKRNIKKY